MAKEGNQISSQSAKHQGSPSGGGQSKADALPVENRDEQTEENLAQDAQDAPQTHPNRNTNKPKSS